MGERMEKNEEGCSVCLLLCVFQNEVKEVLLARYIYYYYSYHAVPLVGTRFLLHTLFPRRKPFQVCPAG